jgi:hypothetical protein
MATRVKREALLATWRARLSKAEQYLDYNSRLQQWREIREYYLNKRPLDGVNVNMIFAIGRSMIPQLYFKSPSISARIAPGRPSNASSRIKARTVAAIDSMIIRQNYLKGQYKLGILDCYRFNLFILKHGYHSIGTEFPDKPKGDEPLDDTVDAQAEKLLADAGVNLDSDTSVLKIDDELKKYSYHELIQKDTPWALRCAPEDFLVPWGTKNIYEAPWCAFRVRRPLDEVKADPIYTKSVVKKLNSNWRPGPGSLVGPKSDGATAGDSGGGAVTSPKERGNDESLTDEYLMFYEVWDARNGVVMAFTDAGGEDFMRYDTHNMPFRLPVSIMQFNDDGEDFWGVSDAQVLLPLAKEYNETRSIELDHKKIMLVKILVDKNVVGADQAKLIAEGKIGPVILVDGPPSQATQVLNPTMSRELFDISDTLRNDIREIIGYSRNSMGEFETSRRTATEAKIVQQNLMLRGDERRDLMADLISESFRTKINPMIFEFWDQERYVEVTGMGNIPFVGTSLKEDYEIEIATDSTIPATQQQEREEAVEIFKTFRGDPSINQQVLYQHYLDCMRTVPSDELLLPPQSAMPGQLAALLSMGSQGGNGGGVGAGAMGPMTQLLQQGPNNAKV